MSKPLDLIMLIDDDEYTNFIHERAVEKSGLCEKVISFDKAKEALTYLQEHSEKAAGVPQLIFLDINMPVMNGWQFIEEYKRLPPERKAKRLLFMLTTSLNPDDEARAKEIGEMAGFFRKPLTPDGLKGIVDQYLKDF